MRQKKKKLALIKRMLTTPIQKKVAGGPREESAR